MPDLAQKISKNNIALICIILLLGIVAHGGMLTAPFKTLDDSISITDNPAIKDFSYVGKIFTSSFFGGGHYYRPLVSISFMGEYHFFGLQSFYYNLNNLGLHLAVTVTVFFLIFFLLEDRAVAFFTSLLFAIHPVHWEAVSNISGRAILLSTFFTINAFYFFCLSEEKRRFVFCYVLSLIFFAGGLLSKESAAMLPVLLLSYMFFSDKGAKKYYLTLPYFALVAGYILFRRSLGVMETFPWRSVQEHILGFVTFLSATMTHLRLFIWPVGLHFDRAQQMFLKFSDPGLLATVIAFGVLIFGLIRSWKKLPGYALFFISWFCIELAPVSQIITTIGVGPGYISSAEHFLYMPSVGIFALIVLGIKELYYFNEKNKVVAASVGRIMIIGVLCALILVTIYQEIFSRTALSMFKRTLEYNPNNARILYSTGLELVNREKFAEAEGYFRRALAREPLHASYHIALGRSLYDQGKVAEAIASYENVVDAGRWTELLNENKDIAYRTAVTRYQNRILREPGNAQVYYSLGTMFSRMGHLEESVEQYKRAVALNPNYKNALFNLASSYGMMGQEEEAIATFERAIIAEEGEAHLNYFANVHLGEIYRRRGDTATADAYFRKAEALKNNH